MCENLIFKFQEKIFSPLTNFTYAKLFIFLSLQGGWNVQHSYFEKAFQNGRLSGSVLAKVPKSVCVQRPYKRDETPSFEMKPLWP